MASSKNHPKAGLAPAIILVLASCTVMWAVEFAGGTGEPNDPYQIATAEQLIDMGQDLALHDKHFALVADIDLDPFLPGRTVFQGAVVFWKLPGGRSGWTLGGLEGSFDGKGHAIRNCVIYRPNTTSRTGVFGLIGPQGRVSSLRVEDAWIGDSLASGSSLYSSYGGILAGENAGTVVNCSATGTIVAGSVTSDYTVAGRGGLIGYNTGTISKCYTQAHVSGSEAGGIAGVNAGVVLNCSAGAYVFGGAAGGLVGRNDDTGRVILCSSSGYTSGSTDGGGLVGTNGGTIQYCSAEGYVSGGYPGGLIGNNSGTVRESYASAWVSSGGGLVGNNTSEVINCYATGLLDPNPSSFYRGGLVGTNSYDGTIVSSYCATLLDDEGAAPVPLVFSQSEDSIRYAYYLATDEQVISGGNSTGGLPLLADEMEDQSSFAGFDFYADANDGSADHWFMPESGYPVLTWQTEITGLSGVPDIAGLDVDVARTVLEQAGFALEAVGYDYDRSVPACGEQGCLAICSRPDYYASPGSLVKIVASLGPCDFSTNPGDGSQANPYRIETPGQLDSLYDLPGLWRSHFVLTADVDLSHLTYSRSLMERFSGTFDGNGHVVRGLWIDTQLDRDEHCGLFGIVEPNGVVRGLTLEQVCLRVAEYYEPVDMGMLVGENQGRIEQCRASGRILGGNQSIGGLVGLNNGHIVNCTTEGRIEATTTSNSVGGLVGTNILSIVGCNATDISVSGGYSVGGLVGVNSDPNSSIEACYTQGSVRGNSRVAGLLAINGAVPGRGGGTPTGFGQIRNCYTTCSVAGQTEVGGCIALAAPDSIQEGCFFLDPNDGGGPDNGLGTALSDAQMKQQASFTGWDFESIWTICAGTDYPRLRWENVDCDP